MKIILSRKGFDSEAGGCASPIFPGGSMASFPIPWATAKHQMKEVVCRGHNLGDVARDLTRRRLLKNQIHGDSEIHLDPDLNRPQASRHIDWRPAFGQDGRAQTHLENQGVDIGDLFLFFGWFHQVDKFKEHWDFIRGTRDVHVIFGWLQVGSILRVGKYPTPGLYHPWLEEHPHIQNAGKFPCNNTIYIASDKLVIDGKVTRPSGGGTFDTFASSRQLTHPEPEGSGRATWQLPTWFAKLNSKRTHALSHHEDPDRWEFQKTYPSHVKLASVYRGQEFVMSPDKRTCGQASDWLLNQIFV